MTTSWGYTAELNFRDPSAYEGDPRNVLAMASMELGAPTCTVHVATTTCFQSVHGTRLGEAGACCAPKGTSDGVTADVVTGGGGLEVPQQPWKQWPSGVHRALVSDRACL